RRLPQLPWRARRGARRVHALSAVLRRTPTRPCTCVAGRPRPAPDAVELTVRTCRGPEAQPGCPARMRELGRPVLAAAAVVVCGAVMTILDSTIVNVTIERLGREFDARLSTIQWVSTAYLLAIAAVIPLAGWAVDRYGTRRVFMTAVGAFA